jgi:hypothetical protein
MTDITFTAPAPQAKSQSVSPKSKGSAGKTTASNKDELQHDLARYVVTWLGAISCILLFSILMSFFLEDEKFKLLIPGLLSAISGIVGYIAGHTARGAK